MKRVLVLDANQRSALAVTRSLGRHSVDVLTAEEIPTALAGSSAFSKQQFTYPSPRQTPSQFIETLSNLIDQHHVDIILPMTELTSLLLLEHQSSLHGAILPFPDIVTVDSLADKCQLMQTAAELAVPTPETLFSGSLDSFNCDLKALPYPVVIKPGKSWLKIQDTWCRSSVRFAGNRLEAQKILDTDPALENGSFMIQEHVPGHGKGVFCLYDSGTPLAFFAHQRLREKPPRGGVSVLSQSVPVDQALGSYARLLLDHAGWHGVAMVEFKVTPDGKPFLMEINTRFWGSLQLAIDAGIDFPWLLYQIASGEKIDPVEDYRIGVRLRWLLGDLDHLYLVLRDPGFSGLEKIKAVAAFLTPSPFNTRHEVNRWNDMGPFWWELKQYIRDLRS